jgi:hypothetical protein
MVDWTDRASRRREIRKRIVFSVCLLFSLFFVVVWCQFTPWQDPKVEAGRVEANRPYDTWVRCKLYGFADLDCLDGVWRERQLLWDRQP